MRRDQFLELQAQETDDCVLWPYAQNGHRYGIVQIGKRLWLTHRLSCIMTYGPPPFLKAEAAHNCGVSLCLNPRHLRWATHKDNQADRVGHGTSNRGERCGSSKLTESQVRMIRDDNRTQKAIADQYGVCRQTISDIKNRKRWAWLT
jgi:hypothetical protein